MDQVEEVKSKVDMVALVGEYVQLKKAGRNYKGLCPFHGEKTPSFMVNPELQVFKCFGCGVGGDCFTWMEKMEGMEFGEALEALAERVGVTLTSYKKTGSEETKEKLVRINALAAQYFHYLLTKHELGKGALEYVVGRGLTDEVIERFSLGFAPNGWDFLIKYLKKKGFDLDQMQKTGLVVEGKTYDRFRNRVMFPLANARGGVVGYAGRILPGADEKAGGKYVNTPETELYHKGELLYGLDITKNDIKAAGWAIIVEGEIDAIASWQVGVKNVVAIKGSALTDKQVELLRRYCDTIVLALDADVAGDAAARRGIEVAQKKGLFVKTVRMRGAKDPGELAIQDPESWKKMVGEAIPIYDFYLESAVARFGTSTQGKMKIGQELVPLVAKIDDEILKAEYIQKLANVLGVKEEDVRAQLVKVGSQATMTKPQVSMNNSMTNTPMTKTRREVVEEYVVGLALARARGELLIVEPVDSWITTPFWRRVVDELKQQRLASSVQDTVERLPAELREKVEQVIMKQEEWDDEAKWEKEWQTAIGQLEEMVMREEIAQGDMGKSVALIKRLAELTRGR